MRQMIDELKALLEDLRIESGIGELGFTTKISWTENGERRNFERTMSHQEIVSLESSADPSLIVLKEFRDSLPKKERSPEEQSVIDDFIGLSKYIPQDLRDQLELNLPLESEARASVLQLQMLAIQFGRKLEQMDQQAKLDALPAHIRVVVDDLMRPAGVKKPAILKSATEPSSLILTMVNKLN